jgi:flagellin
VGAESEIGAQSVTYSKEKHMTSILTNTSAMNALQTLKNTNMNLNKTQQEIASGKSIGSARDNAAVWAISKVMDSDVKGFEQISNSLALGQSTLGVARGAAESVTDLLTDIKQLVVGAQEENVDREKIQTDIGRLREQIESIVGAAQFNGLNLLSNTDTTVGSGEVAILGSLDRAADGTVSARNVDIDRQDLGITTDTAGTVSVDNGAAATVTDGNSGTAATFAGAFVAGDTFQLTGADFGLSADVSYVVRDGETLDDIATEIAMRANYQADIDGVDLTFETSTTTGQVTFTNNTGADVTTTAASAQRAAVDGSENDGTIGGGLGLLASIDVSTDAGATAALGAIEGLIQKSIDASASFGSAEKRIDIQADFVSKLTDSLKSGIGTLVDADMEEASARLQALQVQQQLGVQALSIANQSPQTLLSLFR